MDVKQQNSHIHSHSQTRNNVHARINTFPIPPSRSTTLFVLTEYRFFFLHKCFVDLNFL